MNSEDSIDVSEKDLTFIELYNSWQVPINVGDVEHVNEDEIKYKFVSKILADHLGETVVERYVSYSVPSSTWQTFKRNNQDKWWFSWFVKRHPVEYVSKLIPVKIPVDHFAIFPSSNHYPVELGKPYYYKQPKPADLNSRHK